MKNFSVFLLDFYNEHCLLSYSMLIKISVETPFRLYSQEIASFFLKTNLFDYIKSRVITEGSTASQK